MIKIRCTNYKIAVGLAYNFSKLYSDGTFKSRNHCPVVTAEGNEFMFVHEGKPGKDEVSQSTFTRKYLTQNSQTV